MPIFTASHFDASKIVKVEPIIERTKAIQTFTEKGNEKILATYDKGGCRKINLTLNSAIESVNTTTLRRSVLATQFVPGKNRKK